MYPTSRFYMDFRRRLYQLTATLQPRIVPDLEYSQHTYEARLKDQVTAASAWLDVGCGHPLLPEWRAAQEQLLVRRTACIVGIDVDYEALSKHRSITKRCLSNVSNLPFRDGSFDLVTANMVVEHLDAPSVQFAEVARVLRRGGVFLFHTPNARNYMMPFVRIVPERFKKLLAAVVEGRAGEDVYPTHYRANDRERIQEAVEGSGLAVEDIEFVNSSPVFSMFPPLAIPELLLLRQLQRPSLAGIRATLICRLRKRA